MKDDDTPMGKTHMRKLRVNRVDLVDAGAQPDAHVALFKRRDDGPADRPVRVVAIAKMTDPASVDALIALVRGGFYEQFRGTAPDGGWWYVDAVHDDFVIACAEQTMTLWRCTYEVDDSRHVAFGTPEAVTLAYVTKADAESAPPTEEHPMTLPETLAAITDETLRKSIEDAFAAETTAREAAEAAAQTALAELEAAKARGPEDDDDADDPDAALKALPEDVRKRVEAAESAAAAAQAEVAKVRDEQALAEHVAKARADFAPLGEAAEIGGLIHRLTKSASAEDVATLDRILQAAAAKVDTGELFAEKGRSGVVPEALASEIAKHRAAGMSEAEATKAALDANPGLFA